MSWMLLSNLVENVRTTVAVDVFVYRIFLFSFMLELEIALKTDQ